MNIAIYFNILQIFCNSLYRFYVLYTTLEIDLSFSDQMLLVNFILYFYWDFVYFQNIFKTIIIATFFYAYHNTYLC